MPKVSVVIPSFNCAAYVENAVDSVLAQTLRDCEAVVVDDGSTDATGRVMAAYAGQPRVRYVRQEHRGVSAARNRGARLCDARYLAFLDADDTLAPAALETMAGELERRRASWCLLDIVKLRPGGSEVRRTIIPDGDPFLAILREDFVIVGVFFRSEDFFEIGMYDEDLRIREDWEIHIRMFQARRPFVHVGEPLYLYRWREGSLTTSNPAAILASTEQVLRKHHKRLADGGDRRIAGIYARNMWGLARDHLYKTRDLRQALRCACESLRYDFDVGRLAHPLFHHCWRLLGRVGLTSIDEGP